MQMTRKALYLGISLAISGGAMAQQDAQSEDKAKAGGAIEELTVTATKREASVQDVSVSVTALGEEALKMGGIEDVSRLENLVPGMQFGQSGSEVRLAIRGTRTNNVGSEAEQVVGIFEDGVYVPTTTQATGAYVDVERVEVLRGPQGTLYGRNTFGGTINIHTRAPDFDSVNGYVSALGGSYDRHKFEGAMNVPITDTLAVRFAMMDEAHDGYIENTVVNGSADDMNDKDISYFRGSLRWQPMDELDITLRAGTSDQGGNGSAIWGYQQIGAYRDGVYVDGHQFAPDDASDNFDQGPWKVARNMASSVDLQSDFATLAVKADLGFASLQYTGNYTQFDGEQTYDPDYTDGGDGDTSGFVGWVSDQNTRSHELQLSSNGDGALEWMLGAYWFEQASGWNWLERSSGTPEIPHWDNQGDYTSDSVGYFGHATLHATEDLRFVAGLRYAEDSKQQRDPLDWSTWRIEGDDVVVDALEGQGVPGEWDDILWKGAVEFDLNDDQMVYGQVSTGYRAGGINFVREGVPLTYDPETVKAWEIGYKSAWFDNALVFNAAAYLNQYRNMQAQSFVVLNGTASEFTENGGSLDSTGLELEATWIPAENWRISASAAFMNAEFDRYEVSKVQGLGSLDGRQDLTDPDAPLLDLKGYSPALSPDMTLGLQVSYDFLLNDGSRIRPYLQTYYSADYYAYDINVEGAKQDAYTKTDLRLIWESPSASTEVQAFVMNLEDEAVLNRVVVFNPSADPSIASLQANFGNPRTWGMNVSYHF
ncbi:TonB-dependent receptor [Microbulbifer salipaludis]|uniref:TonB-dependent receptor n=1 Tax=Microbulbifer salipaludis TaxID=187980 RepID=A0ABS3E8E6_9GAMM|nr:TonB-dependent receptor [Microbulbifer salipaludis]MBN8431324.1 TonB-dependent receptor [Microbulbifer salipaludis]